MVAQAAADVCSSRYFVERYWQIILHHLTLTHGYQNNVHTNGSFGLCFLEKARSNKLRSQTLRRLPWCLQTALNLTVLSSVCSWTYRMPFIVVELFPVHLERKAGSAASCERQLTLAEIGADHVRHVRILRQKYQTGCRMGPKLNVQAVPK